MRRKQGALLVVSAALAWFSACSGEETVVNMVPGREFSPSTIRVEAGETVTFANESPEAHTVTAYESGIAGGAEYFASGGASSEGQARADVAAGLLAEGETFTATFDAPGRYSYFCIPHEDQGMEGVVIVSS